MWGFACATTSVRSEESLSGLFLYIHRADLRNELRLLVFAVHAFTSEPSRHTLYAFCINFTENFNGTKHILMTSDW